MDYEKHTQKDNMPKLRWKDGEQEMRKKPKKNKSKWQLLTVDGRWVDSKNNPKKLNLIPDADYNYSGIYIEKDDRAVFIFRRVKN